MSRELGSTDDEDDGILIGRVTVETRYGNRCIRARRRPGNPSTGGAPCGKAPMREITVSDASAKFWLNAGSIRA